MSRNPYDTHKKVYEQIFIARRKGHIPAAARATELLRRVERQYDLPTLPLQTKFKINRHPLPKTYYPPPPDTAPHVYEQPVTSTSIVDVRFTSPDYFETSQPAQFKPATRRYNKTLMAAAGVGGLGGLGYLLYKSIKNRKANKKKKSNNVK